MAGVKLRADSADAGSVGLLGRCAQPILAGTLLIGCGSADPGTADLGSTDHRTVITDAGVTDPVVASNAFEPTQVQLGSISDFHQGVNELDVPHRLFVIVEGSDAFAFDRKDPNNGCTLFAVDDENRADFAIDDPMVQFFDQCHGHAYDLAGQSVLCPGTRTLRHVDLDVVDGIVTWAGMTIDADEPPVLLGGDCGVGAQH